ncbi:MAG: sigma-70 family RNA polymerase sigma factor [Saprospiraceae bacterium]
MEKEFQQLIDQHYGILYKIGRVYARDQADFEDLFQEMLIQLWHSFPRFKGDSALSTYLYRVVLNTALTHHKKASRRPDYAQLDAYTHLLADESHHQRSENDRRQQQVELLYQCINQLKIDDRAIILLHLEGNTYEEMADILGITITNIGVRLLRVKKRLHKLLTAAGYERI